MLDSDAKRVIREQRLGFFATVNPDGTPNLSPKGTLAVLDDEHLVFAEIRSPGTIENLLHNPAIEINIVDPFLRKGYRFCGRGTVVTEGPRLAELLAFYEGRTASNPGTFVVIDVDHVEPLISPVYDRGFTEDQVREQSARQYAALGNIVPPPERRD